MVQISIIPQGEFQRISDLTIEKNRLRRLGGPYGHPDICTPGKGANYGSLGMGVSKAKGMAIARRIGGQGGGGQGGRIFVMKHWLNFGKILLEDVNND